MPQLCLFDLETDLKGLLPLTYTRSVSDLRLGILTLKEKWEKLLEEEPAVLTAPLLQVLYAAPSETSVLYVRSTLLPNSEIIEALKALAQDKALFSNNELLAFHSSSIAEHSKMLLDAAEASRRIDFRGEVNLIRRPWHIFQNNRQEIIRDFRLLTEGRKSQPIDDPHTVVYGKENLFSEEGAKVRAATLNAEKGPIYIGKYASVEEGAIIRGAAALCENSVINTGAKLRGDNTVGPFCKVGGEVSNSVFWGYSNKGHDGFLGNSVIGAWCNLGAGTNSSNLKNNYGNVSVYDYSAEKLSREELQFCGLLMGDHSKAGIDTMFNTATSVGVAANVFGGGFPPKHIPSFSWGGGPESDTFKLEKVFEMAEAMMKRRGKTLSGNEKNILKQIFEDTKRFRTMG